MLNVPPISSFLNFVAPLTVKNTNCEATHWVVLSSLLFHFAFILCSGFWWGNLKEGDHLEDLGIDVGVILRFILNK